MSQHYAWTLWCVRNKGLLQTLHLESYSTQSQQTLAGVKHLKKVIILRSEQLSPNFSAAQH